MIIEKPDFYLGSTESYEFGNPRRCFKIKRLHGSKRDDYMLAKIDPPIVGQKYGLGARDINHVVIATRFKGDKLFPVSQWPLHVHVARLVTEIPENIEAVQDSQMEEIAWAELYPTEEAARTKRFFKA